MDELAKEAACIRLMLALTHYRIHTRDISERLKFDSNDAQLFDIEEVLEPDPFGLADLDVSSIRQVMVLTIEAEHALKAVGLRLDAENDPRVCLDVALADLPIRNPQLAWQVARDLHKDEDRDVRFFAGAVWSNLFPQRRKVEAQLYKFFRVYVRAMSDLDATPIWDLRQGDPVDVLLGPKLDDEDFLSMIEVFDRGLRD